MWNGTLHVHWSCAQPRLHTYCFPFCSQTLILVNRLAVWGSVIPPALPGNRVRSWTFSSGISTLLHGVWASQCFTLWKVFKVLLSSEQFCFPNVPETGSRMMTVPLKKADKLSRMPLCEHTSCANSFQVLETYWSVQQEKELQTERGLMTWITPLNLPIWMDLWDPLPCQQLAPCLPDVWMHPRSSPDGLPTMAW